MITNANSIVQHIIQIKNGIMEYIKVSVKIIKLANKIIVGSLAHAPARTVSI